MFVVTGLDTKRRPRIGTAKSSVTIRKQGVERLSLPPVVSHPRQHLHPVKLSSSSFQTPSRILEARMTPHNGDKHACNRNESGRRLPINDSLGRVAPPRVRRFIPKPLILVERMKARQFLLDSSPHVASEFRVVLGSLPRPDATPFSTHVTPPTRRLPRCSTLSSDSHSSSSVSIRVSSRNGVVFGSDFGMMPRRARPLSGITLGDSSSSTDTFVVDSPCFIKRASSKVPLLVTANNVSDVYLGVETDSGKESVSDTGVPIFVGSVAADFVYPTRHSNDGLFEPTITSTPFASSQAATNRFRSPIAFISTTHPVRSSQQLPKLSGSFDIVSTTSCTVYPPNAPKDTYIVKLPNSGSGIPAVPHAPLPNAPKPALDLRRLSNRTASPSPTLVLDGVFALPQPSQSSPPPSRRTFQGFPRPRKPYSRRPLVGISNAQTYAIGSPSQPVITSPSSFCGQSQSGPESPRSKLAHVLTAHAKPPTMTHCRQPRVPPVVRGIPVSNDPRTQREIEGLRVRRMVGLGHGAGGSTIDGGRGAIERMSLASVGMVAKLRARWETGTMGRTGGVDGCV